MFYKSAFLRSSLTEVQSSLLLSSLLWTRGWMCYIHHGRLGAVADSDAAMTLAFKPNNVGHTCLLYSPHCSHKSAYFSANVNKVTQDEHQIAATKNLIRNLMGWREGSHSFTNRTERARFQDVHPTRKASIITEDSKRPRVVCMQATGRIQNWENLQNLGPRKS